MSAYDVSSRMMFQNYDYEVGNIPSVTDVQRCSRNFRPEKAVLTETIASQLKTSQDVKPVDEFCSSNASNLADERDLEQDRNGMSTAATGGFVAAGAGIGAICGGLLGALIGGVVGMIAAEVGDSNNSYANCKRRFQKGMTEVRETSSTGVRVHSRDAEFAELQAERENTPIASAEEYNEVLARIEKLEKNLNMYTSLNQFDNLHNGEYSESNLIDLYS